MHTPIKDAALCLLAAALLLAQALIPPTPSTSWRLP
jgi:hypothetical protein